MNKIYSILGACLIGAATQSFALVDPSDYVLEAYPLPAGTTINVKDGVVSQYWATVNADNAKDYTTMTTGVSNTYPGAGAWTGPDDAGVKIRAAFDAEFLYMYVNVKDNVFIDPERADLGMDAVDFVLDGLSSVGLAAEYTANGTAGLYNWGLTKSSIQFQVWMGAAAAPTSMRIGYYDPTSYSFAWSTLDYASLSMIFKDMGMDVITVSSTEKVQEWKVPFSALQLPLDSIHDGKMLAFAGGYNDMDATTGTGKKMRWRMYDPYAPGFELASYGDIKLIGDTTAIKSKMHSPSFKTGKIVRTELFNLRGEKIVSEKSIMKNSFVIKKSILADGKSFSEKICWNK